MSVILSVFRLVVSFSACFFVGVFVAGCRLSLVVKSGIYSPVEIDVRASLAV